MEYRTLGGTEYAVARLGIGAMRLPMTKVGDREHVDFDRATEVLLAAFRAGINYVDGGLFYGNDQAEIAVGRALRMWPARDHIILTTKATKFQMKRPGDLRRMLEHQLQRLERDWVHFYLLHGIGWTNFHDLDEKTGWFNDLMRAREEGLLRHVGFSFHDAPEKMIDLIDMGWAELVTCQYNYLDRRNEEAMAYAAGKGLAVVVMGPVGGGRLSMVPKGVAERLNLLPDQASELALRFVASNPHVDVILSGMGSSEMVEQNVAAVQRGPLAPAECDALKELMDANRNLSRLYCTGCEYCMPCPQGVQIPRVFELYNYLTVYGLDEYAYREYAKLVAEGHDGSHCVECGVCLEKCPQELGVPERLRQADAALRR